MKQASCISREACFSLRHYGWAPDLCQSPMTKSAFSLVELLVVIAVIAVVAAISIPNIQNISQSAKNASKLHNAQNVVSIYNSYVASHQSASSSQTYPFSTKEDAIVALIASNGLSVTNTRLRVTNTFRVPVLSTNDIAMDQITMDNGQLLMTNQP